jgi:hypothetical protein
MMAAETTEIVDVLDPRGGKMVPRSASLYLLAQSETLLLCRAKNPAGDVIPESNARKIHADAMADADGALPYQCSPDVCGYCLENGK